MLMSVIVTTYNWPSALKLVLNSLLAQQDKNFEILIADDGSTEDTANLITQFQKQASINITHVHQQDNGFRAAKIRNKAIAKAQGKYIIFIDGDCIVLPNFIAVHRKFAKVGYYVAGNRVLLSEKYSAEIYNKNLAPYNYNFFKFVSLAVTKNINRYLPFIYLPLGKLRDLKPARWKGVKTCNLAVFKRDLLTVNGFDENFTGWGYEDSDLVVRLIKAGIKCRSGRFAIPVLHIWHKENDRSQHNNNLKKLQATINKDTYFIEQGLSVYL